MRKSLPALVLIGVAASVLAAPSAGAAPVCDTITVNTTWCTTNGSTQIVTSPPKMNFTPPWFGPYFLDD